eukprot:1500924-Pleurochrysis_carterae.AAC.1
MSSTELRTTVDETRRIVLSVEQAQTKGINKNNLLTSGASARPARTCRPVLPSHCPGAPRFCVYAAAQKGGCRCCHLQGCALA